MNTIELKLAALALAADARREEDGIERVYEVGQAVYEWLMEDVEFKEKPPTDGQKVIEFPN